MYIEVIEFIETNHCNPSCHRIEDHDMQNWLKANRKRMNVGKMKEGSCRYKISDGRSKM